MVLFNRFIFVSVLCYFTIELDLLNIGYRLLSGVKKHFIFQHHDGKVSVRNNVVVTHLTSVSEKAENCLRLIIINILIDSYMMRGMAAV